MINKRPWQICTLLPLTAALLLGSAPVGIAQQPASHIDLSSLKYTEADVVVPNPSEVFIALDKLGSPNWKGAERTVSAAKPINSAEIAMQLGVVIAEGFVAVEAKDREAVEKVGHKVLELATALGVKSEVLSHTNAILEAARDDKWNVVRTELDKAKSSVRAGMDRLHSQANSQLVSIAGWLRGTNALTSLIRADYKPERSELLHQPDLLRTFDSQLGKMETKVQENKKVMALREGLKKVKALIPAGANDTIDQKTVEAIDDITSELVKTLAP